MADQGDRVAAVVARTHRETISVNGSPAWGIEQVVGALDRAGLLLTEARRGRVVDVLTTARARLTSCEAALRYEAAGDHKPGSCTLRASDALHAAGRCDALLRELAGEPQVAHVPTGWPSGPVEEAHGEPPTTLGESSSRLVDAPPRPAPRRMFGPPDVPPDAPYYHAGEHDERHDCALGTPCQPVAAAAHDPRDFDPGAGGPMGVLPADPPAHEHRWAAVAWGIGPGYRRVTREHCVVGDCKATREVGHGA